MQAPVANRATRTANDVGSNSRIAALAAEAQTAEARKNRLGSSRSARPRTALVRVPTTKPACTLLVSADAWPPSSPNSAISDGITAVAENHSENAQMPQKPRRRRETRLDRIYSLYHARRRSASATAPGNRIKITPGEFPELPLRSPSGRNMV